MSRIGIGDLVLVTYPAKCCDGEPNKRSYIVSKLVVGFARCAACGHISLECMALTGQVGDGLPLGYPIYMLSKVAGPFITEDTTHEEEIAA